MSKKILMVLTSHKELGNTGRSTGFWLEEFANPYYIFLDNGFNVILASPMGGKPPIDPMSSEEQWQTDATKRFNDDPKAKSDLDNTIPISEINPNDYNAIFFPGGHGPMWDLSSNEEVANLVSEFYNSGKPVAAVCHGPAALTKALDSNNQPIIKGKKVTGFTNSEEASVELDGVVPFLLEDKLKELGGEFKRIEDWKAFAIADGKIITGQNPASSEVTAKFVIKALS